MFKDVILLVGHTIELDEMLQEVPKPYERQVFANKRSVSQTEFFNGGQGGLKPQYQFEIRLSEFNGENELIHEDKTYSIYRTFENGENIELYCEVRIGGN